jgi:hypothetical protein
VNETDVLGSQWVSWLVLEACDERGVELHASLTDKAFLGQQLLNHRHRLLHRCGQLGGLFAAGLGEVGLAAAGAADDFGDFLDPVAGADAAIDEVFAEARDEELINAVPVPEQGVWVDMGGGTGANLEYFGEKLPNPVIPASTASNTSMPRRIRALAMARKTCSSK